MPKKFPFTLADLLLIRWQIVLLCLSAALSSGLYYGIDYMYFEADRDLRIAKSKFQDARSSVELIEEEEATIIRYIDEYLQLSEQNVIDDEDRLQFLEKMAEIREALNLFPISLKLAEQSTMLLPYDQDESSPGEPVDIGSSTINLSMPLLHEEDLTRVLGALFSSPGLYQIRECDLSLRNTSNRSYVSLGQHMSSNCDILWYTFSLSSSDFQN